MGKISKVVVCGQRGCGKTALLEQLIYGNHDIGGPHCPTIEDIYVANVETDRGVREKVRFYDTAGLDSSNNEIPRHYLTFAEGFILVYSITSSESFARVDHIKKDIDRHRDKKEITIVVIGNKCDLEADRQVDILTAQNWASREKVRLFEVSVMDKKTLTEPFTYITSKMNQPPSKSSFPLGRKTKGTNQSDT